MPTTPVIPPPATSGASLVLDDPGLTVVSITPFNYDPSVTWPAGSMISTLEDLERWARALATGELLSPTLQQQRLSLVPIPAPLVPLPAFPGPTLTAGYGLGIFNAGGYLGHDGDVPGYEVIIVYEPQTGATIVQLQNADARWISP